MTQYISKSTLVAEIERRLSLLENGTGDPEVMKRVEGVIKGYKSILSFLDTLEVKEINNVWYNAKRTIPEDGHEQIICIKEDGLAVATVGKIVNGTIKWAYLNDLLDTSSFNVETKDVNLEKELERLDSILYDLDGIAIAGTTNYLTVEDVKDIARRFFKMGLNARKEE